MPLIPKMGDGSHELHLDSQTKPGATYIGSLNVCHAHKSEVILCAAVSLLPFANTVLYT